MTTHPSSHFFSLAVSTRSDYTVKTPTTVITPTTTSHAQGNLVPLGGNLISLNISSQIPFKLAKGGGNYASRKSQMTNILSGCGLLCYVDGPLPCPLDTGPQHPI
ncbi:F-box domain-containing protein [Forsythia ovata]|uniref:F-box domain-containing protein n=1 Tax=Forsythia ovata TaxID=205694 RepID=A0ABD1WAZ1_9LAMI